jgi:hypothetical protein
VNEKYSRLMHQYDAFDNMHLTNVEVQMNTIEECFAMEFVILVRSTRAIALPNLLSPTRISSRLLLSRQNDTRLAISDKNVSFPFV